jgi:hypothetical protein
MNRVQRNRISPVVGWLTALVVGVAIIATASYNASRFTCDSDAHLVHYGDTLWAIAEAKCDGNIGAVVDNLVDIYTATIHPGDLIWLPLSQSCLLVLRDDEIYDECE